MSHVPVIEQLREGILPKDAVIENTTIEEDAQQARIKFVKADDGRTVLTFPDGKVKVLEPVDSTRRPQDVDASDVSPARARLAQLKANAGPRVVPVEVLGETFYILRLNWPEHVRFSMMLSRDAKGNLVAGADVTRDMTAAVLACCIVCGENDTTPYFSREDAFAYVDEPATAELVAQLWDKATDINSTLIPKGPAGAKTEETEPDFSASDGGSSTPTIATQSSNAGSETEREPETAGLSNAIEPVTSEPLNS